MNLYLDIELIRKINSSSDNEGEVSSLLLSFLDRSNTQLNLQEINAILEWPTLLEYIGLGDLLQEFPLFTEEDKFFNYILSLLPLKSERAHLIQAYDQLFAESLTLIKQLPQVDVEFILKQIQVKKGLSSSNNLHNIFKRSLNHYEQRLLQNPAEFMHDLILYLAWDRVCVNLAIMFEYPALNLAASKGLDTLIECLLESYQHITAQKRTSPSFFRVIESLYAYHMREENLETHSDAEWVILCEGASTLKSRSTLPDVRYIDAAIKEKEDQNLVEVFTLDSIERVQQTLALAQFIIDRIKASPYPWHYSISPCKVTCLN